MEGAIKGHEQRRLSDVLEIRKSRGVPGTARMKKKGRHRAMPSEKGGSYLVDGRHLSGDGGG